MKKDAKEILNYDIDFDTGLGDEIRFCMTKDEFFNQYNIEEYLSSNQATYKNGVLRLFDNSITLFFSPSDNFKLISINVSNLFKGKYLGKIGVGTPFGELRALKQDDLHMDDNFHIGEGYMNEIVLDEDEYRERCKKEGKLVGNPIYYYNGEVDDCNIYSIFFGTEDC